LLDIIIFVPYNLFRLFLVHKISIYVYIYMKIGKRNGKRKNKRNSLLTRPRRGDFGPASAGARARVGGPAGPRRSGTARAGAVGAGLRASERGVTASGGGSRR
jgi:hypothetical protein